MITLNKTPSEQIIDSSKKEVSVVDSKGRTLVLCEPSWFSRANFLGAIDADKSTKTAYLNMVSMLMYVVSIDKRPVVIKKQLDIDGYLKELDNAGFEAIGNTFLEHFSQGSDLDEEKEKIKK